MRIIISGLLYPMTMLHWFWRAFERRKDVELCVVGPFFGNWIPWQYGLTLPDKWVKHPDIALPQQAARMLLDPVLIEVQLPEYFKNPDLWVQIDAGWHLSKRPTAQKVALIETDPHVLKTLYTLPKSYSDFTFCMQGEYMADCEHYLPYGYDPKIHHPDPTIERFYDACLIGLHYPQRDQLVEGIRHKGHSVYYTIGEIYDDYRNRYNQSKIALSWSTLQDLPARAWEGLALGNLLVANRLPDMDKFFEDGVDYLGFSNLREGIDKVEWALSHWDEAQVIADAGHKKVQPHTWDARVEEVLKVCGLI